MPSGTRAASRRRSGSSPAIQPDDAASRAGATSSGATPISTHAPASTPIGRRMAAGASPARHAASVRASPRKTVPNTFTKQATASAPIAASTGTPTATRALPPVAKTPRSMPR